MKIEEIDKNLFVSNEIKNTNVEFINVKSSPFIVYGLYNYKEEPYFTRMPYDIAKTINSGVESLSSNTAGGRVRFSTDSPFIAIKCKMKNITFFPHMPLSGTCGFDIYKHVGNKDIYFKTFMPPTDLKDGFESLVECYSKGIQAYTIHFPLYNDVMELEIGLKEGSKIEKGPDYQNCHPIVYYGSSITQGGCVSRPGNSYENIISAHLNIDHINLGFSGSAHGENRMAKYISKLNMSVFVLDYDHNACNLEELKNTHKKFFEIIRENNPILPVVIVSKPNPHNNDDDIQRRNIIYQTYIDAYSKGDTNVYFIDGKTFFSSTYYDSYTVDDCHPNDAGHIGMANIIGNVIDSIINN